jgi:hypothetical protein
MTTLTDLTNKMKSVGKGLQRTSAFPIDKWQLWDSFNDSKTKLVYVDPTTNTSTECDSPGDLAQLVANSAVSYPGFTFNVVDINNDSYSYIIKQSKKYSPIDGNINRYVTTNIAVLIPNSINVEIDNINANSIIKDTNNSIDSQIYTLEYSNYWSTEEYHDNFYGLFFNPILYSKYSVSENSTSTSGDIIAETASDYIPLHAISIYERSSGNQGNIFLSMFEVSDDVTVNASGGNNNFLSNVSINSYTYLGSSDTSARLDGNPAQEEHIFTFTKTPIILNKTKNYLLAFTNTNNITDYTSNAIVNIGVYSKNSYGKVACPLCNANGTAYGYNNHIPVVKFHAIIPSASPAIEISKTFSRVNSPNIFTDRNTFTDISASSISSEFINLNDWAVGVHSETGNYAGALRIGTTDINKPIILDTRNQTTPTTYGRIIAYGNIQLSSDNSTISYKTDLPTSYNDNTLATTKFTKSNINSVSSALNTAISTVSSNITTIVNNASSFISGEVSNLSSKVINDVSSVSSAIDSKIIMRIWN